MLVISLILRDGNWEQEDGEATWEFNYVVQGFASLFSATIVLVVLLQLMSILRQIDVIWFHLL